jgi:hypothetical protein
MTTDRFSYEPAGWPMTHAAIAKPEGSLQRGRWLPG